MINSKPRGPLSEDEFDSIRFGHRATDTALELNEALVAALAEVERLKALALQLHGRRIEVIEAEHRQARFRSQLSASQTRVAQLEGAFETIGNAITMGEQADIDRAIESARIKLSSNPSAALEVIRKTQEYLTVAESECHQILEALKPWISGNPDRTHLDLAHLSNCSFRAWGALLSMLRFTEEAFGKQGG